MAGMDEVQQSERQDQPDEALVFKSGSSGLRHLVQHETRRA
jgi:hypothetical protein